MNERQEFKHLENILCFLSEIVDCNIDRMLLGRLNKNLQPFYEMTRLPTTKTT